MYSRRKVIPLSKCYISEAKIKIYWLENRRVEMKNSIFHGKLHAEGNAVIFRMFTFKENHYVLTAESLKL